MNSASHTNWWKSHIASSKDLSTRRSIQMVVFQPSKIRTRELGFGSLVPSSNTWLRSMIPSIDSVSQRYPGVFSYKAMALLPGVRAGSVLWPGLVSEQITFRQVCLNEKSWQVKVVHFQLSGETSECCGALCQRDSEGVQGLGWAFSRASVSRRWQIHLCRILPLLHGNKV